MDDSVVETSASCKRQRVCEEEEEDRISSLPDSILIHILSFLPTIDAVRTVLVPRFRHLWHFLPTLTFDHSWYFDILKDDPPVEGPFYHEKFLDFVRHVLVFHENATLDEFVLEMDLNFQYSKDVETGNSSLDEDVEYASREKRMASEVDSWVYFAMRKNLKVLHLNFSQWTDPQPSASYRLPCVVLREIVMNDEIIDQILSACPVLEHLFLFRCYRLCRLGIRNPSVKSLELFHPFDDERLELSCPYIESLEIAGCMDWVFLADVSSIVVSCITFSFNLECLLERYQTVKEFFEELSHGKMFKPCNKCILVFRTWQLMNQPGLLFRWKYVEFELCPTKWHQPGISYLLRTSPYLETLAMYIPGRSGPFDDTHPPTNRPWMESFNLDGESFWSSQEGAFHCLENHLKTIKIYGDITKPYVIDMIDFLLKNAMVLEKLEISTLNTVTNSYRMSFL
ncbi:hypothetical protein CCACVL1_21470 [Corchorus capsularis]|uniref:Uncharacterized protein n=1 Tax=Corchorus capsularis TaxID=210143 RepID=A0A1R3H5H4_COCAP|nr:hypothetical protein CCACVL1_21470 [Corchorus capsularis]